MIINRNNYEEYFLLYTDNELGEAERKAVEHFADENPDLKNELISLQKTVLHPDEHITFAGKSGLLKLHASSSVINQNNYTEYFLLYADNELSNDEKAQVEEFVYDRPEFQAEFEMLQSLKVSPDNSITFENKEILLHHTSKPGAITAWLKYSVSVAAALILVLFGYLNYNNTTDGSSDYVISQQVEKTPDSQKKHTPVITIDNHISVAPEETVPDLPDTDKKMNRTVPALPEKKTERLPLVDADRKVATSKVTTPADVVEVEAHGKTLQPKELKSFEPADETNNTVAISMDHISASQQQDLQLKAPAQTVAIQEEKRPYPEILIAGFPVTPKSKVGNFLSKTSRLIKRTKQDISEKSDQLLGGFEIAIR